jgi:hypothetical protein
LIPAEEMRTMDVDPRRGVPGISPPESGDQHSR